VETKVTPEQFDQAVNILASICAQSAPPEGSQLTLWQWVDANRNALNILVSLARTTMERPAPETFDTELIEEFNAAESVSVNGSE
jgi:hypothetical protein